MHTHSYKQTYYLFLHSAKRDPFLTHTHTHLLPTPLNQYGFLSKWMCTHSCMSDCMSVWALQCLVCFKNSINIFQVSYRNWSAGSISLCRCFLSAFAVSLSLQMLHVPGRFSVPLPHSHTFVDLLRFLKYHFPSSPLSVTGAEEQIGTDWIPPPRPLSLSLQLKWRWGVFCSRASVPLNSPPLFLLPAPLSPYFSFTMSETKGKYTCICYSVLLLLEDTFFWLLVAF